MLSEHYKYKMGVLFDTPDDRHVQWFMSHRGLKTSVEVFCTLTESASEELSYKQVSELIEDWHTRCISTFSERFYDDGKLLICRVDPPDNFRKVDVDSDDICDLEKHILKCLKISDFEICMNDRPDGRLHIQTLSDAAVDLVEGMFKQLMRQGFHISELPNGHYDLSHNNSYRMLEANKGDLMWEICDNHMVVYFTF